MKKIIKLIFILSLFILICFFFIIFRNYTIIKKITLNENNILNQSNQNLYVKINYNFFNDSTISTKEFYFSNNKILITDKFINSENNIITYYYEDKLNNEIINPWNKEFNPTEDLKQQISFNTDIWSIIKKLNFQIINKDNNFYIINYNNEYLYYDINTYTLIKRELPSCTITFEYNNNLTENDLKKP